MRGLELDGVSGEKRRTLVGGLGYGGVRTGDAERATFAGRRRRIGRPPLSCETSSLLARDGISRQLLPHRRRVLVPGLNSALVQLVLAPFFLRSSDTPIPLLPVLAPRSSFSFSIAGRSERALLVVWVSRPSIPCYKARRRREVAAEKRLGSREAED